MALTMAGVWSGAAPAAAATTSASGDVTTGQQDTYRTAWDPAEPALTQPAVSASNFGQLFSTQLNGQVYAQPLVVQSHVIAATETNWIYGLDSATGAIQWSRQVGPDWDPTTTVQCGDIAPVVGITSTPVYDPATDAVYFTAKTNDGGSPTTPNWYVHAVDPATGAERTGWPVRLGGSPSNDPTRVFNAETAAQRPGLLLLNGVVYAGFASYCDRSPYVGYVVGVSTTTAQVTAMWSTESGTSTGEGGIWQSGGGLVSDGSGIYFATGNGIAPPPAPGATPPATLAESVVHLAVQPDGSLRPVDFFSPANNAKLDQDDADLGSGGPMAIPDGYGTAAHPHLLVQIGKDGHLYVMDRDHLGGMGQGANGGDAILAEVGPYNGVWGRPAFLGTGSGGYIYLVGNNGPLRVFKLTPTSSGGVSVVQVGQSAGTFPYSSGSPTVTSSGTDGSSAVVWTVYSGGPTGAGGELRAYAALPTSTGTLTQLWSAPLGTVVKFAAVTADGGRLYAGSRDGKLFGFGAPTHAAVAATATDLGSAPVGVPAVGTVTLTASRAVTLTAITAAAPFAVRGTTLPATLAAGGTLAVPVSFTPSSWGQASGNLTVTTADGETVQLGVRGLGTAPGLGAAPASVSFTDVPTGSKDAQVVSVVNTGTAPVTITGVTLPTDPALTVDAGTVPAAGTTLQPQGNLAIGLMFGPSGTTPVADGLTVASDAGAVTIPITATAISGASKLTVPASLAFGPVAVGLSSTLTFPVTNSGNIPLVINKAKAPAGVFSSTSPLAEGLAILPGATVFQSVTFSPTAVGEAGTAATYYLITGDDGSGPHQVMLTGSGVNDPVAAVGARYGGSYLTPLGVVAGPEYPVGSGLCQNYTSGAACWSTATGAHAVPGSIGRQYLGTGGAGGFLGFPVGDQFCGLVSGGCGQFFQGGAIYWSPPTSAHPVTGAILADWGATGWERTLGYPITDMSCGLQGGGCAQHFGNGASIYWSPAAGAHAVQGAIRAEYAALGWEHGLGYPTGDMSCGLVNGGCGQFFQGGAVYWSPGTGAHAVSGAVLGEWGRTGWEHTLGYPTGEMFCGLVNGGCGQHFSNAASIYWSPTTGAHAVTGGIRSFWAAQGWERGTLGYPTSGLYAVTGAYRQNFQRGVLSWNTSTGVVRKL